MKLMIALLLIAVETLGQIIPIGEARKLRSGSVVRVAGRVTASKEFGDLSFVQDATAAIPVYSADVAASVGRGDSVVVTGKLAKFNGLLEIIPDSVRKVASIAKDVKPKDVEFRRARDHEAELIRVTGVVLKPPGHFLYPQRPGLMLKGNDSLDYWIDGDTDLPGYSIPPGAVSVTGVVGRFRDEIQLLPRSVEDIPGLVRPTYMKNEHALTIMNWNLEFFGAAREKYGAEYGPPDEAKQIANVASLLNVAQPGIVALQEISDDAAFGDLVKKLPGYEGRCSSRYSYSYDTSEDFPPQKVCFVFKTGAVRVVREKVLFRKLYDDALSSQSDLLNDAPGGAASIFASGRLPYFLEIEAKIDGITDRVCLVNIHGKSGASIDDHARRVFDAKLLKDSLDRYYPGRNLIVLGDLNDDLDVSIAGSRESPYAPFVNDVGYTCISKTLSDNGWHSTISYDDMIDHQVVSRSLAATYIAGSARVVNPFGLIERYAETTSDHLPVISEFDLQQTITGIAEPYDVSVFPNPNSGLTNVVCPGYFEYRLIGSNGIVLVDDRGIDRISLEVGRGIYILLIRQNDIMKTFRVVGQ